MDGIDAQFYYIGHEFGQVAVGVQEEMSAVGFGRVAQLPVVGLEELPPSVGADGDPSLIAPIVSEPESVHIVPIHLNDDAHVESHYGLQKLLEKLGMSDEIHQRVLVAAQEVHPFYEGATVE